MNDQMIELVGRALGVRWACVGPALGLRWAFLTRVGRSSRVRIGPKAKIVDQSKRRKFACKNEMGRPENKKNASYVFFFLISFDLMRLTNNISKYIYIFFKYSMYLFFILFSGRPISPIATFYVKITQPFKNSNKPIKLPTALTAGSRRPFLSFLTSIF